MFLRVHVGDDVEADLNLAGRPGRIGNISNRRSVRFPYVSRSRNPCNLSASDDFFTYVPFSLDKREPVNERRSRVRVVDDVDAIQ